MALPTVLSYDARDVTVVFGELELEGPGDDAVVTIAYTGDAVTTTVGAQGFVVATINADQSGMITWTGSQASPTNDRLSAIAALQRQPGAGLQKRPILVKHNNGTTLATGTAWIKKVPDAAFAKGHNNREWAFEVAKLEAFVGGSTR